MIAISVSVVAVNNSGVPEGWLVLNRLSSAALNSPLWMARVRSYERRYSGLRAKLVGQKSLSTESVGILYISTPK
ncbi:hypothetical protein GCM10028806_37910 [Spirosoma terrae]